MIWDAIIIGAGPAGSTLALSLSRQRLRVLLLDQARFPRAKVCGGCLNGNALATLTQLGLAQLRRQLGCEPIRNLQLATQGHFAKIRIDGVSISRTVFDAALIEHAVEAGATFREGVRATMQAVEDNARRVEFTQGGSALGRVVILAHGLKAGTIAPQSWIGAGVMLENAPPDYATNTISMAIGRGGYVGGVHLEGGHFDLPAALDATLGKTHGLGPTAVEILRQAGFPPIAGLAEAPWKGTPHLTRRPDCVAGERWFTVGDAAGYVEPFTGEGMAWAMSGALALAPIVASPWQPSHVKLWQRTLARTLGPRQRNCRRVAKILHSPRLSSWLVRGLAFAPQIARPFVRGLNRGAAS